MPENGNPGQTDELEGVGKLGYYHAEIIDISLMDAEMIRQFEILDIRKRFCGLLKIYTIAVPEEKAEDVAVKFQKNLGTKLHKEWYISVHNAEHAFIVFRNRIFSLSTKGICVVHGRKLNVANAEDKDKWEEVIAYAIALGVPENQCDFLPEGFEDWGKYTGYL